jgi:hypothetical protein
VAGYNYNLNEKAWIDPIPRQAGPFTELGGQPCLSKQPVLIWVFSYLFLEYQSFAMKSDKGPPFFAHHVITVTGDHIV